jgi:hypothetical protein
MFLGKALIAALCWIAGEEMDFHLSPGPGI